MNDKLKELTAEIEAKYRGFKWYHHVSRSDDKIFINLVRQPRPKLVMTEYKGVPVEVRVIGKIEVNLKKNPPYCPKLDGNNGA